MPLKGVVLCCTSIGPEDRTKISAIAAEMGAEHKYDLTSDVTHLLIGDINTPKYRYVAKERPDIKVLTPDWVLAVRDTWMAAEDVDVRALEDEYRAPPFLGLKICLTGFDDLDEREEISQNVRRSGAEYSGDLTRDITHLIAAAPKGKKYEYARQWNVKVVSLEWLNESIVRGMALDETLYDPNIPSEERGQGAWRKMPLESVIGKRPRQEDEQTAAQAPSRRKLRRTVSEKFGSQAGAMWADITSQQKDHKEPDVQPEEGDVDSQTMSKRTEEETQEPDPEPSHNDGKLALAPSRKLQRAGIFQHRLVSIDGFDEKKTSILRQHLISNDAVVVSLDELREAAEDEQVDGFLVVPHDTHVHRYDYIVDDAKFQLVNECWVETCLHSKIVVEPADDETLQILCCPPRKSHIEGFEDVVVCSTGFAPINILHLAKFIKMMGGRYDEYLKEGTSVLICNSETPNQEKLQFAVRYGIPVVNARWLWMSYHNGKLDPVDDYLLDAISEKTEGYSKTPRLQRYPAFEVSQARTQDTVKLQKPEEQHR
ncbi:BRCT domain-containing protein [Rhizodiscina lignyota]|uniref:BRCT domain-containing protein n=1 Tax=Rhizodiscina lignyota TaxID=1504668 RepID=A0A9P4MBF9_9PEZI|nr:BRCT domain-containing protein [Rhizodiscina lignyota]